MLSLYHTKFGKETIKMDKDHYINYILEQMKQLLAIASPTGYTKNVCNYMMQELRNLGYEPEETKKGGVLVALSKVKDSNGLILSAHMDTLGGMVAEVKGNGRLRITNIGGLNANNVEAENCKVITRFHGTYEGTLQLNNASIHVNGSYNDTNRNFDNMELVLDEKVFSADDTKALGIAIGDFVSFDPRTTITEKGFIKSRFLDDKLSAAILLGYAYYLKQESISLNRSIYCHFTVYEEVGHGCSASMPDDVAEIISIDMGCVGEGLDCDELKVSICAKDSRGPYDYNIVNALICVAKKHNIAYALDLYPHYGSDADAALIAGYDVKHGLIGPGVYASHGYERSHIEGLQNTFELIKAYTIDS